VLASTSAIKSSIWVDDVVIAVLLTAIDWVFVATAVFVAAMMLL
jgi:hypothetical protein